MRCFQHYLLALASVLVGNIAVSVATVHTHVLRELLVVPSRD